jgi:RNA polymerase sigma-70 factor (sigma-E family)
MDRYEGFHEFVNARQQVLMRTAYLLTGDAHLAEDLLQTAFAKVARHWSKLARDGNPEAYTRRCLINESISWRRRRRWYAELPSAHPPESTRVSGEVESLHRITLRHALAKLAPRQRAVIVLRFYEDRSVQETAELLNCSPGTVKSQTSQALGRLRDVAPELAGLLSDVDPAHQEVNR